LLLAFLFWDEECKQRLTGITDDIHMCNEFAIVSICFALLGELLFFAHEIFLGKEK